MKKSVEASLLDEMSLRCVCVNEAESVARFAAAEQTWQQQHSEPRADTEDNSNVQQIYKFLLAIKISVMDSCDRCSRLEVSCVFPEDSEQCYQCRDVPRRCDGSVSEEHYQQLEDEIQNIQSQMDDILMRNVPQPDILQRIKDRLGLLKETRTPRTNEREGARHEQSIAVAKRELHQRLESIRRHALPTDPQYQALLKRYVDLEERHDEIIQRYGTWDNEILEMTGYPHYRGLPLPEDLNDDEWKDALAWVEKHGSSSDHYPDPSFICDATEGDSEDEMVISSSDALKADFRNILRNFYPLFDTLVQNKALMEESLPAHERNGTGLGTDDITRIKSDLDSLNSGIKFLETHVDQLKEMINIRKASDTSSVSQHLHNINRNFVSLFSTIIDDVALSSASRDEGSTSQQRVQEYYTGIEEVERFMSKLSIAILLFPEKTLEVNNGMKNLEIKSDQVDEDDMHVS